MVRRQRIKQQSQEDKKVDPVNPSTSGNPDGKKQSNTERLIKLFSEEKYLNGYLKMYNEFFDTFNRKKWNPVKLNLFFLICRITIGFGKREWEYGSCKEIAAFLNAQPEDVSFYIWQLEQDKWITHSLKEKVIHLAFEIPEKEFTAIPYRIVKQIVLRELSKPEIIILLSIIRRTVGDVKNNNLCFKYKNKKSLVKAMGYTSLKVVDDAINGLCDKKLISLGKNRYNQKKIPIYIYFTPESFIPTDDNFFQFLSKRYPNQPAFRSDSAPHFDQSESAFRSEEKEAFEPCFEVLESFRNYR